MQTEEFVADRFVVSSGDSPNIFGDLGRARRVDLHEIQENGGGKFYFVKLQLHLDITRLSAEEHSVKGKKGYTKGDLKSYR